MRLGLSLGSSRRGRIANLEKPAEDETRFALDLPMVLEAERLGYHVYWSAESYGADAMVPLAWVGAQTSTIRLGTAIMQIPGRTPANAAMAAMALDGLSGGRFLMGLGVSGPQVVEGWHGVPFGAPVKRTREYVTILRRIFAREEPVEFQGEYYQMPYRGPKASGLGKPLKTILHPRKDIPIYLAAMGPRNVALAGELCDGILPTIFSPDKLDVVLKPLKEGAAKSGRSLDGFDVAPSVPIAMGKELKACFDKIRPGIAFSAGVYGAKGKNFYNDVVKRYGYEEVAEKCQDLYLAGHKEAAIATIPDQLCDEVALCGSKERIKERLTRYNQAPIKTINIRTPSLDMLRTMAELVL